MGGICAVLLAAGLGRRYRARTGADKLLEPSRSDDASSREVILGALDSLRGVAERLLVVVREDNVALLERLRGEGCQVLPVVTRGLGHSLAQAVAASRDCAGWLVALADMPYVRPASLRRLAELMAPDRLVAPRYQGRFGHPRGIGGDYLDDLLALDGERGAQALFQCNPVLYVPLDDPGVLRDVDRPEDRLTASSGIHLMPS